MRNRTLLATLSLTLALAWGCSSSDDPQKDSGPAKDTGVEKDKGSTPTPDSKAPAEQGTTGDQGAGATGQLALEIWEMKAVASGKTMFDLNKKTGEDDAGWTFEPIDGVKDAAIIITAYDGGWYAYGYRGPFVYQVISMTAADKAALKADTLAFIKHLAGKLPDASAGKKVEEYVPAPGEVSGWVEDDQAGKPGVEAAYDDAAILAIIDGHHAPYQKEGCAGFAKQDYKK
jgi:hypothetical protein